MLRDSSQAFGQGPRQLRASRDTIQSRSTIVRVKPQPPMILAPLTAGDRLIRGTAEPSAKIKVMVNEVPLRTQIPVDTQGGWQVKDLPSLKENDQITCTQIVRGVQSVSSSSVVVAPAILQHIAIHPQLSATVGQGQTQGFTASGTFSDGRVEGIMPRVTWSTDDPSVATIDPEGIVTGITAGSTTIQASREGRDIFSSDTHCFSVPSSNHLFLEGRRYSRNRDRNPISQHPVSLK